MQASQPFFAAISAASFVKSVEKKRVSCAMTSFGLSVQLFAGKPVAQIVDQALSRAADAVEVHRVGADAGKLRPTDFVRRAAFGRWSRSCRSSGRGCRPCQKRGCDRSGRSVPSTRPPRPAPRSTATRSARSRFRSSPPDVGRTGLEQPSGRHRVLDLRHFVHCATFPAPALVCKL